MTNTAQGQPFPGGVRLPATPPSPKQGSIGIALVGLGYYALGLMAPAIAASRSVHIAAVVSGNRDKAKRVAAAYGLPDDAIYDYENFGQIADDDRVQASYILLPTGLHADWTVKSFAAGKHVLVEKPMALTAAECERMIAAGKAANRVLMVGYRCYFEPFNMKAMDLMRQKAVGDIRVIRTDQHYMMGPTSPAENWRANAALAGTGPLEDYGIYGLQAALYLSNEAPTAVSAHMQQPDGDARFAQIAATTTSQLHFPSGAVAQLATSYNASGANRVEVRGNGGVLLMDPATGYGGQKMSLSGTGDDGPVNPGDPRVQFAAMIDHFGGAIRGEHMVMPDGAMGLRDMRLIEAIRRAAREGRTIRLNPDATMA